MAPVGSERPQRRVIEQIVAPAAGGLEDPGAAQQTQFPDDHLPDGAQFLGQLLLGHT